jgi:hypothetical protein
MAYGIRGLAQVQLGRESTAGTPVTATTIWRGRGMLQDDRVIKFPAEDVGILPGTDRSYIPKLAGSLLLESVPATFEQFPHILEMGVKTATASADGAGSDFIYEYSFPTTAANTIKTYTAYTGDNNEAEVMEYCFATDFTLTGDEGEAWMMSANAIGRQVAVSTFSATAPLPTVQEMLFQKTKLYIDAATAAWGTTIKSNTLLSAQLTYKTGNKAIFTADGNLYFSAHKSVMPEIRLRLTYEHDTIGAAQKVLARAQTAQKIRLKTEGNAFTSAGTAYSVATMLIDVVGKYEKFNKIGERNGNDIIEFEFVGRYNADAASAGIITIANELSALP